jgi:conjugative transposon TraM protein
MNNEEKKKDLNPPVTGKEPLTEAERIKRKKMIVYAMMGIVFVLVMWLIFAPSGNDGGSILGAKGFNTEMPDANSGDIIGDKTKAYEASQMEDKQQAREQAIGSLGELYQAGNGNQSATGDFSLMADSTAQAYEDDASRKAKEKITSSAAAYNNLNTTLGGFYQNDQSRENEELRQRVAELEERANELQNPKSTVDEQLELMEKSYQMAAKYMPGGAQQQQAVTATSGDKVQVTSVRNVQKSVVSALQQEKGNEEFMADYSVERNMAFNTAVGIVSALDKNTISACIYGNQTVTDGQKVRLRLLEQMRVGDIIIPANSVVTGSARITGERLGISVTSIEYAGSIYNVKLSVYDTDGQEGIFIPGSMELNAAKKVAANMGTSMGSSINISSDAKAQLASDLGKGLIQGTSQYIAKKMRTVKVHLKSNYRVMLYADKQ